MFETQGFDNPAPTNAPSSSVQGSMTTGTVTPLANPLMQPVQGQANQTGGMTEPNMSQAQQPVTQPITQTAEPILGKFKSQEEFINGYKNLEAHSTRTSQEVAQLKSQLENYQMIVTHLQNQVPQQQQQQMAQPTPEEIQQQNEQLLSEFYENPSLVLDKLAEKKAREVVAPIENYFKEMQDKQVKQQRADTFVASHPDWQQYQEDMTNVFRQFPDLQENPNAFDIAYNYAKGQKAEVVKPETLVNDENFLNNFVLNNEAVKNKILQQHMASIQGNKPPQTLGNQTGGSQIAMPSNQPKTLQQSTDSFLTWLGVRK